MATYNIFEVIVVFSDGTFARIEMNCTNSIEAIKGALSLPSVVLKITGDSGIITSVNTKEIRDIVEVKCKKTQFKA